MSATLRCVRASSARRWWKLRRSVRPHSEPSRMSISLARVRARSWRLRSASRVDSRISSAVAAARTQTTDSTRSTMRRSRRERQGTIRIGGIITARGSRPISRGSAGPVAVDGAAPVSGRGTDRGLLSAIDVAAKEAREALAGDALHGTEEARCRDDAALAGEAGRRRRRVRADRRVAARMRWSSDVHARAARCCCAAPASRAGEVVIPTPRARRRARNARW